MKQTYDWRAAETAIRIAIMELQAAARHVAHRKRINVLNDLVSAEAEMSKALRLLSEPPR